MSEMTLEKLSQKIDESIQRFDESIQRLAEMTMNGFRDSESRIRADFMEHIDRLDKKIDYRFDALSTRIDDLSLNRATTDQHMRLEKRTKRIEKKLGLI